MRYEPFYYQEFAERFILGNAEAGLFLDMGMGKTAITLSAVEKLLRDYFTVAHVLVIAPLAPAKQTWPAELKKWDALNGVTASLVVGSEKERFEALQVNADIHIINRENVQWLVDHYRTRWPFDMVVIDELSSFKSSKAARFKALRKVRKYIRRIVGLTGTPSPNGLLDLWAQVYLLDGGKALGRTLTSYRERYFEPDKRSATTIFSWKLKDGAEKEIYKQLDGLCISMKSSDYLQLPERLDIRHEVELSQSVMEQYRQLERDMLLPFADGDIDAGTAGILTNKLLQFCGGSVYDENGVAKEFHDAKLNKLGQLVEEVNGQPVLVFYAYKHERDRILAQFPQAVDVKDENAIERWNAREIPILLAHPASAGHGLNLQFGGHIAIWYNLTWSLELYQQANKRLHRMGQGETVLIHHIIVAGGIDSRILTSVLAAKDKTQNALIDALRAIIREVLAA